MEENRMDSRFRGNDGGWDGCGKSLRINEEGDFT